MSRVMSRVMSPVTSRGGWAQPGAVIANLNFQHESPDIRAGTS